MIILRLIALFWKPIAAILVAWGLRADAKRDARRRAKIKALEADQAAHERINNADIGIGASDDERIKRLREFADRNKP